MPEGKQLFSVEEDKIILEGIEALVSFTKYSALKKDSVLKGVILAEDLLNDKGGVLYSAGQEMDHQKVSRLIRTADLNPNFDYTFRIKRGTELTGTLKGRIKEDFNRLLKSKMSLKAFQSFLSAIDKEIEEYVDEIFTSENLLFSIYQQKMQTELSKVKQASTYYNHAINVALFSLAIAKSPEFADWNWDKEKYVNLMKAALLHNLSCVNETETLLNRKEEFRRDEYFKALKNNPYTVGQLYLKPDIMEAIRKYTEYYDGRLEILESEDDTSRCANMLVVSDMFCQGVLGLFEGRKKPKDAADKLNVMVIEGKLNQKMVEVLTKGLLLDDLFDFYQEMQRLMQECPFGRHAWPYPMTGFKSPVLFVCKINKEDCDHYEHSVKAVSLVTASGGLEEGKYCRCLLTSPQLQKFYDAHYEDIKEESKRKAELAAEKN